VTEINEFAPGNRHFGAPEIRRRRTVMTDLEKPIISLHERLESLRRDFDREFTLLFAEVDAAKDALEQARSAGNGQDKRLRQLEERAEGQSALIATLTQEAQEARALRDELRTRELEIEKLASELASKGELIHALRHQLGDVDGIKTTAKQRDKKIFEQQHELERKQQQLDEKQQQLDEKQQALERAQREVDSLRGELAAAAEVSQVETSVDTAEIVALKSELDARKSMIRSLRADAERAEALEGQLEAKRETIGVLEASIEQQGKTIAELRRSVDAWKKKYQAAKGEVGEEQDQTLVEPPEFTDTEIEALKELDRANAGAAPDRTLAIDMRDALKEARRQKSQSKNRS
jgi:chromosome segregation ATPase